MEGRHIFAPGVRWALDGKTLASVGVSVRLWDAETGRLLDNLPDAFATSVAWSPDGKRLVSGSLMGWLYEWNPQTGQRLLGSSQRPLVWGAAALSPDGRVLATANFDGKMRLWQVGSGQLPKVLTGNSLMTTPDGLLAWSSDGKRVVVWNADSTLLILEADSGKFLHALEGPKGGIWEIVWSPDGGKLALLHQDGSVRIWDTGSGKLVHTLPRDGDAAPLSVSWSADGNELATLLVSRRVQIWDTATWKSLRTWKADVGGLFKRVAFAPQGQTLAVGGEKINLYESDTGKLIRSIPVNPGLRRMSWSPDGKKIVAVVSDGQMELWDSTSGALLHVLSGHASADFSGMNWSPDGRTLATSNYYDSTTRLWDAESGQPGSILILFPEDRHLILMPDGHFRGTPGIEQELVCVVLTEDGRQETLTTAAFASKYGWKNDPDKVRLAGK